MTVNLCPLCNCSSRIFYQFKTKLYHQCENCSAIFMDKSLILNADNERLRYEEHNNDVENIGYQKFVSPITSNILKDFNKNSKGLDFGAGTGPVIAKILKDNEFNVKLYDPFFHNNPNLLKFKYDYIACCEVMEHFHKPKKEFKLLKKLLKENARLYCMTDLYDESIDFHKWYYKNDSTHVFIYHKNTIKWIKDNIGFSNIKIDKRLIIFEL